MARDSRYQCLSQLGFRLQNPVQAALSQWLPKAGYAAGLLLRSLRDKAQQWWYFLNHPEVPPDNNRSERSLRLAVTASLWWLAFNGRLCTDGDFANRDSDLPCPGAICF